MFKLIYLCYTCSKERKLILTKGEIEVMGKKLSKYKSLWLLCLVLFVVFISFMFGYLISNKNSINEQKHETWKETDFYSEITREDCIICKTKQMHSNENNLGIFFLNDGTAYQIGINKYDDHGRLVEKEDTYSQMLTGPAYGESMSIQINTNRDRGYATVDIGLGDNENFDIDKVSGNCCEECIAKLMDDYYSVQPYDILILNYSTGDMQLITSRIRSFTMDDYYVSCEQRTKKGEDEISEIDLLIFFCPKRFSDK